MLGRATHTYFHTKAECYILNPNSPAFSTFLHWAYPKEVGVEQLGSW